MHNINGILCINKPKNITSNDLINIVKRETKIKKIGHTGTLDPMAQGLLILCFNEATKILSYLDDDKEYIADIKLGIETDTYDLEGKVLKENEVKANEEDIRNIIEKYTGKIDQIPPMYSAVKYKGKRLYNYARKGIIVEREERKVKVYSIEILNIKIPEIKIKIFCSKGTYIRSLCSDMGRDLGCGAVLTGLVRTRIGKMKIENSLTINDLEEKGIKDYILNIEDVLELPKIILNREDTVRIINGNYVNVENHETDNTYQILNEDQKDFCCRKA